MSTKDKKNLDDLIENLSADLKPMTCLSCPKHRALKWFIVGLMSVVLVGALIGFRMDLLDKAANVFFAGEVLLALLLSWTAAYASAWLALPEGGDKKYVIYLPYAVILVAAVILIIELFYHELVVGDFEMHHCIIDSTIMGLVPLFMMIWMMRKGATTHPFLSAVTNMIATGSIGYVGMRLTCGNDEVGHVCTYHIFPFIFVGLCLGLLARKIYRW